MSLHDLYLISPQLAVAAVGLLVILLDLLVPRKDVLPAVAFVGLVVPLLLLLHQVSITGASFTFLTGWSEFKPDALQGSFSVDEFSLFFNFLVLGSVALVVLASEDYVRQMPRFRGEYFGLLLFSASGMMLAGVGDRVDHHLYLLGTDYIAVGGVGGVFEHLQVQRSRHEVPDHRRY